MKYISPSLQGTCVKPGRRGFTLVEIVVVLAVVALLIAITVPSISKVLTTSSLTTSGAKFRDLCVLARQTAQTKNLPVELRLYKVPNYNADTTSTPEVYRAFQIFVVEPTGTNALTKPEFFKAPVVLTPVTNASSLLVDETAASSIHKRKDPVATDPKLGIYQTNYQYIPFRFLPGGGTDLETKKNFVTLILQTDKALAQGGNFYTVQIDPVNGAVRTFRP